MKNTIIQKFMAGAMVLGMMMAMAPADANAQFTTDWQLSDATTNKPAWFGADTERGFAYGFVNGNHRLYVASRNGGVKVLVLNADTGAEVGNLNTAGVSGGTFAVNDVEVSVDGQIFAANMTTGANASPFKVYRWDSEAATASTVVNFTSSEVTSPRLGDKFAVTGSVDDGSAIIWAASANSTVMFKWVMDGANFVTTPEKVSLAAFVTGGSAHVSPRQGNGFYHNAGGRELTRINDNGTTVGVVDGGIVANGSNAISYITSVDGFDYVVTFAFGAGNNNARIVRTPSVSSVSSGILQSTTLFGVTPTNGSTTNGNGAGDVAVRKNSDGTFTVYVLATNNGISSSTTTSSDFEFFFNRRISGDAGWRMLASPASGKTVGDLTSQNLVQGVTGGTHASSDPNIFTSHNGTDWQVPASTATVLTPGTGFIWYMFNNTSIAESVALPFTLNMDGTEPATDVTVSVHSAGSGFNLLGNPFNSSIDVTALTSDGTFTADVQVWSDGVGESAGGASVAGSWVVESSRVAAFQGFMLENIDATEVTIPISAKSTGGVFHKSTESFSIDLSLTAFNDAGNAQVVDRAARLVLNADANDGWDRYDMTKLGSLDPVPGLLYFAGERNGEARSKAQESRNIEFDHYEIPLDVVRYSGNGEFRVSWTPLESIPDNWSVQLVDNVTNEIVDMRLATFHDFQVVAAKSVADREIGTPVTLSGGADSRFKMVLSQGETTDIHQIEMANQIALSQNYPNPFNPTTRIAFELPSSQFVKLSVFNMLGQEVSTLLQSEMNAGSHFVNFDASQLSSGVYVYRLEAGGQVITRKMTLVK